MDAELLQRVMNLAEKTGDRVIVVNPESGIAHAILPFDAYEDLVDGGTASLRNLEDEDFDFNSDNDDEECEICKATGIDQDDFVSNELPKSKAPTPPPTDEEIEKMVEHDLDVLKLAEQSQKEAGGMSSLDVLDDEANEEHYYLEPLE